MKNIQINDGMYEIIDLSEDLISLIDRFSDEIYIPENNKHTEIVLEIIDKLDLIMKAVASSFPDTHKYIINHISLKLPNLLYAFENGDTLLISDILYYEIKPLLRRLIKNSKYEE